jgi:hypothetical protein
MLACLETQREREREREREPMLRHQLYGYKLRQCDIYRRIGTSDGAPTI